MFVPIANVSFDNNAPDLKLIFPETTSISINETQNEIFTFNIGTNENKNVMIENLCLQNIIFNPKDVNANPTSSIFIWNSLSDRKPIS